MSLAAREQTGWGEDVGPAEYYLRDQSVFGTVVKDNLYNRLNYMVAVGVGKQEKLGVTYDVYQIL